MAPLGALSPRAQEREKNPGQKAEEKPPNCPKKIAQKANLSGQKLWIT